MIVRVRAFFDCLQFFFHVIYTFGLLLKFFLFPYLDLKLCCFLYTRLLMFRPLTCLQNFLSLFWKVLFCLYCLILPWHILSLYIFYVFLPVEFSVLTTLFCFRSFPFILLCVIPSFVVSLVFIVSLFILLASLPIQLLYLCSVSFERFQTYPWMASSCVNYIDWFCCVVH